MTRTRWFLFSVSRAGRRLGVKGVDPTRVYDSRPKPLYPDPATGADPIETGTERARGVRGVGAGAHRCPKR